MDKTNGKMEKDQIEKKNDALTAQLFADKNFYIKTEEIKNHKTRSILALQLTRYAGVNQVTR